MKPVMNALTLITIMVLIFNMFFVIKLALEYMMLPDLVPLIWFLVAVPTPYFATMLIVSLLDLQFERKTRFYKQNIFFIITIQYAPLPHTVVELIIAKNTPSYTPLTEESEIADKILGQNIEASFGRKWQIWNVHGLLVVEL